MMKKLKDFTPIPNEFISKMFNTPICWQGAAWAVFVIIARSTWGWKHNRDNGLWQPISVKDFMEVGGYSKTPIMMAIKELEHHEIIERRKVKGKRHLEYRLKS